MGAQYRTINRGGHSIYEGIRKAGYDPYVQPNTTSQILLFDLSFYHPERITFGFTTFALTIGSTRLKVGNVYMDN